MADRNLSATVDLSQLIKAALEGGQSLAELQKRFEGAGVSATEFGAAADKVPAHLKSITDGAKTAGASVGESLAAGSAKGSTSLEKLGADAAKSGATLGKEVTAGAKEASSGLTALESAQASLLARWVPGMAQISGSIRDVGKIADESGKAGAGGMATLAKGAAEVAPPVLAAAAAFVILGKGAEVVLSAHTKAIGEVVKLKTEFGLSAKEASGLAAVFHTLGKDGDDLDRTVNLISKAAENGSGAFAKLGVSTHDSTGHMKGTKEIVLETISAFANMKDGIDKNVVGQELMGRGWNSNIAMMNKVRDGHLDLNKVFADGATVTEQDIKAVEALQKAQGELHNQIVKVETELGGKLVPAATEAVKALSGLVEISGKFANATGGIERWLKSLVSGFEAAIPGLAVMVKGIELLSAAHDRFAKSAETSAKAEQESTAATEDAGKKTTVTAESMMAGIVGAHEKIQGAHAKTSESTKTVSKDFEALSTNADKYSSYMAQQYREGLASLDDMTSAAKFDHAFEDKLKAMTTGNKEAMDKLDADTNKAMEAAEAAFNASGDKKLAADVKFFEQWHKNDQAGRDDLKKLQDQANKDAEDGYDTFFSDVLDKAERFGSRIKSVMGDALGALQSLVSSISNISLPSFHTGTPSVNRAGAYRVQQDETIFLPIGSRVERAGMGPQPGSSNGAAGAPSFHMPISVSVDASGAGNPADVGAMVADALERKLSATFRDVRVGLAARGVQLQGI